MADRQVPSIGRVVHYVGKDDGHRAAIVTYVRDPGDPCSNVGLCVFDVGGIFFDDDSMYEPAGVVSGSWHWTEYVPAVKA